METVKENVLRDLEYLCGGIDSLRALIENDDYRRLFSDWKEILVDVIDAIEGCEFNAENS